MVKDHNQCQSQSSLNFRSTEYCIEKVLKRIFILRFSISATLPATSGLARYVNDSKFFTNCVVRLLWREHFTCGYLLQRKLQEDKNLDTTMVLMACGGINR